MAKAKAKAIRRHRAAKAFTVDFTGRGPTQDPVARGMHRGLEFIDNHVVTRAITAQADGLFERFVFPSGFYIGPASALLDSLREGEADLEKAAFLGIILTVTSETTTHVGVAAVRAKLAEAIRGYEERVKS